ncbi:hypothetical protein D9758_003795 [Tetrapyrgos nigripes]|uniref:Uncharacterized protein n=1 Tax=Tetrapyrgos nigripes TaxID=182062 RepID=A0A8H5LS75_9AGAR|nr:hypothetical protein D9758_003795 [Tetrapyrgos nigripes]
MLRCLHKTVQSWGGRGRRIVSSTPKSFRALTCRAPATRLAAHQLPDSSGSRQHSTPESTRNGNDELARLEKFLTSPSSSDPLSPEQLKSLYVSIKTHNLHSTLKPAHFSAIIGIFGSISLPPTSPRIQNRYVQSLCGEKQDHWSFVSEVVADKLRLGQFLNDGDRYWVMSMHVHEFHQLKSGTATRDQALAALSDASIHYDAIWMHTKIPEILAPYIATLMSLPDSEHKARAINHLSNLLATHSNIHARILALCWNVFLQPVETISPSASLEFVQTMRARLSMRHPDNDPASRGQALASHRFDKHSKRHARLNLEVQQLIASLTATFFPLFSMPVPLSVTQWASRQAQTVLGANESLAACWNNLSLLALYHLTKTGSSPAAKLFSSSFPPTLRDWHVVLALGLLESMALDSGHMDTLKRIIQSVWSRWKTHMSASTDRPVFVDRAIMSSFLRLCGRIRDHGLLNECREYIVAHGLWKTNEASTHADRVQVQGLMACYTEAFVLYYGPQWSDILVSFGLEPQVVAENLVEELSHRHPKLAYQLYVYCSDNHVSLTLPVSPIVVFSCALASPRYDLVVPVLQNKRLNLRQKEDVLQAILEAILAQRSRYLDRGLASVLLRTMTNVYKETKLNTKHYSAFRYAIPLLVNAGPAHGVVHLVKSIYKTDPAVFTPHFFRIIVHALLRRRHFNQAVRLYRLLKDAPVPIRDFIRRKLVVGLAHRGAVRLARKVFGDFAGARHGTLELMARRVDYRIRYPDWSSSIRVLSLLKRRRANDIGSIKFALLLLLNSRRAGDALRLFQRSRQHLDTESRTWFGNVFLNRYLRHSRTRNKRAVQRILKTRVFLAREFDFAEDRVTVNIIVRALLRWTVVLDSLNIQALFDDFVRCGYPVAPRWRHQNNVPFGSSNRPSAVMKWLSTFSGDISFEWHIRPLYKMFIKAFHVRGDAWSAKTMVGIYKDERANAIQATQSRQGRK